MAPGNIRQFEIQDINIWKSHMLQTSGFECDTTSGLEYVSLRSNSVTYLCETYMKWLQNDTQK